MRFLGFFAILLSLTGITVSTSYAGSPLGWTALSSDNRGEDFKPYLEEEPIRQRSLWDMDDWTPQVWITPDRGEKQVIRQLYDANIITDQYVGKKNIPVLEVGDAFRNLSGIDRMRVLEFVDFVFQITASGENGTFIVYLKGNKSEPMGIYNQHGFQRY